MVLIDAENIGAQNIKTVLDGIETLALGTVIERRMYGNFAGAQLAPWVEVGESLGIDQRQSFTNVTNAADFTLAIEATKLTYDVDPDGYCLISCDRDLATLMEYLRKEGFKVYGFGTRQSSRKLRKHCTEFFYIEDLMDTHVISKTARKRRDDPGTIGYFTNVYDPFRVALAVFEPRAGG